jgi:TPR repeat protein
MTSLFFSFFRAFRGKKICVYLCSSVVKNKKNFSFPPSPVGIHTNLNPGDYMNKLTLILISSIFLSPTVSAGTAASLCNRLFDDVSYSEAVTPCTSAAEGGDLNAQTILGELYDHRKGVAADASQSARWWGEASAKGHLPAQNLLALKYYYGGTVFGPEEGWKQDYNRAMEIWRSSAERGEPTSQFMLAEMYKLGQGAPQNPQTAYAWFMLSSQGGYKLATDGAMEMSRIMTPQQKQQAKQLLDDYTLLFSTKQVSQ